MTKQQDVFNTVKALVGQANILTIPRVFIDYTGDMNSALLLSQLLYWYDRTANQEHVVYKTYGEWEAELGLTKYQTTRAANILKDKGILETFVKKADGSPTVHYKLNVEAFTGQFVQHIHFGKLRNLTIESKETSLSITETTTETTTSAAADSKQRQDISQWVRVFEKGIGQPCTPLVFDQLVTLAGEYGLEWFREAVKEAVECNGRSLRYVTAILQRWQAEGFRSPKPQQRKQSARSSRSLNAQEKADAWTKAQEEGLPRTNKVNDAWTKAQEEGL